MAEAVMKRLESYTVTLTLDPEEAGYLRDLLSAHVAGPLVQSGALGRINKALIASGAERYYAYNSNGGHAVLHTCDNDD